MAGGITAERWGGRPHAEHGNEEKQWFVYHGPGVHAAYFVIPALESNPRATLCVSRFWGG
jgi:hypothetical protein